METFISINRLVYDPVNRPGIHRDCKNPAMADWKILKLKFPPPEGYKAGEWKEILKSSHETKGDVMEVEEVVDNDEEEQKVEDVEEVEPLQEPRPKRQKKTPEIYSVIASVTTPKPTKPKAGKQTGKSKSASQNQSNNSLKTNTTSSNLTMTSPIVVADTLVEDFSQVYCC